MIALALAYLRDRALVSLFSVVLIALGVATLVMLLLVSAQVEQRFARDSQGIDLVVGAKGSPLQLVLSSVYHVDTPTGNIPLEALDMLRGDPLVAQAIPLALGDNFRGFRIVGTEPSFLGIHDARVADGRMFEAAGEVVVGAQAASATGLAVGQKFVGTHGIADEGHTHDHAPMVVTGVLAPTGTVTDRLILTPVETVWLAHGIVPPGMEDAHAGNDHHGHDHHGHDHHGHDHHGHDHHGHDHGTHGDKAAASDDGQAPVLERRTTIEPEVTAVLIGYRNAMAAIRLPSAINRETNLQAASPATETARLLTLFGAGLDGARLFAWAVALSGALSIFVVLLSSASAREADMALLRVMGARPSEAAGTVMLEGVLIAGAGAVLGIVLAHGLLAVGAAMFPTLAAIGVGPGLFHPGELGIAAAVIGLGAIAALIPALKVYRTDLAATLAKGT